MTVLRDILVPLSVIAEPARFGGSEAGDCRRGDLHLSDTALPRLARAPATAQPRMVIPALTEAHCHLDKCHSGPRLGAVGGDLRAAIEAQAEDKRHWSEDDLRNRMMRGLTDLRRSGCYAVRSHIDWGDTPAPPLAWSVLAELAQQAPDLTIQTAALTGVDQWADRSFCRAAIARIAATHGGVPGAFLLGHDKMRDGLRNLFAAASDYGLALDFHVDEGLGDFNGLEMICDVALEYRFEGPILCGHAVSLIDRAEDDLRRITDKLLRAGVAVCALPTTNLYLQDRRTGTPDRRGLTRLRELHRAGVPVVIGSDNVDDAFCPMGHHDPRASLHLAALTGHLDPPMGNWLPAITRHAEAALGLAARSIETVPRAHLRLCDVASTADLIAGRAPLYPLPAAEEA